MYENWLTIGWKMLVLRGVLAVVFGILALFWPLSTILAFVLLWGLYALADGIGSFVHAFSSGIGAGARVLHIVMGLIALAAGVIAVFRPISTAVVLTWVLGIWLLVRAVFELVGAFSSTVSAPRWMLVVSAVLDLILGLLLVANPGASALALVWVIGLMAVIWGAVFVVMGLWMRREANAVAPSADASTAA